MLGWSGEALTLKKGQGAMFGGRLTVNSLNESGVAIASLTTPAFRAEDYPFVRWSILSSNAKPKTKVKFVWRTAENNISLFERELVWADNSVAPLRMDKDTNWRGQITGIGLMVHSPLGAPLVVEGVKLERVSPFGIVWREWFGAEPWLGSSVNFVGGNVALTGKVALQWLKPLPFVVAVLGLTMLGYGLLVWRNILVPDIRMIWMLVFVAWFALDMRWQLDLWQKLGMAQQRYAGKSWEEKHLAAEDGPLFYLMQQIRAKLPPSPSRIFIFADKDYGSARGAYHLYPFNVLGGRDLFPMGQFNSGDFIIILGKGEVEFDSAQHLLKWGVGQQLSTEILLRMADNFLLRVR